MVETEVKLNPQAASARGIAEKKEAFLLWLKKRKADDKKSAEQQPLQADFAHWRAVMVWIDDGGRVI